VKRLLSYFCLLSLLGLTTTAEVAGDKKMPFTPDDMFRLEELNNGTTIPIGVIAPDDHSFAFVLIRPKITAGTFQAKYCYRGDHADIWIAFPGGDRKQNITNGATDNAGFWAPKWSPDGQNLAMLSTRGGDVRAWVWSKRSRKLQMLSGHATNLATAEDLQWVSSHELAFTVLPEGEKASCLEEFHQTAKVAEREWAKAASGREPTASVLESGIPPSIEHRPKQQLLVVDVETHKEHVIETALTFSTLCTSPDGYYLAFLKQVGIWRPDTNHTFLTRAQVGTYQLEISDIRDGFRTRAITAVSNPSFPIWSPDSTELAIAGFSEGQSFFTQRQVFRCEFPGGRCRPAISESFKPARRFMWYAKHTLLVIDADLRFHPHSDTLEEKVWAVSEDGKMREMLVGGKGVPSDLLAEEGGASVIGINNGSIWRMVGDGHGAQNLTPNFPQRITSIEWPKPVFQPWAPMRTTENELIFGVRQGHTTDLYRLELRSGVVTPLAKPLPGAKLVDYDTRSRTAVLMANDHTGTYLWFKKLGQQGYSTILETNTFLRQIYEGNFQKIEYRSLDGQELTAWIILPFSYQTGSRYPVVEWVYGGDTYGNEPPEDFARINFDFPINLQLLSAHGYVVLIPSMPEKPLGSGDKYMEATNGALPAVDRLIDLGIADPRRVGLIGQSDGGYTTYGLITQTNRFQAAVALGGPFDMLSYYGTFDGTKRYDPFANESIVGMQQAEIFIGAPPWKDLNRYVRNSPVSYAERIETPLLILQGDLDFIPIQQGEEVFSALYEQSKRARFVRYWGEGHVLDSPANVRDMWQQIYTWFDEHLLPEHASSQPLLN
jgi:dipeptidyl aminopeptidase/acylaminoacyl peptidase